MKKNILLINPWIYDFSAYDFWIKPLGLLSLASLLRKNGYNVRFIDCLDPFHPQLKQEKNVKLPKRYASGHGKFPKEIIPKPYPLASIKRRYHRYGITPNNFHDELLVCNRPDLILVTSMMTYWYPGVFEVIKITKHTFPGVPIILGGVYATLCPDHASKSGADVTVCGEGEKYILDLLKQIFNIDPIYIPDKQDLDSLPYPAFDLMTFCDQVPILTSKGCPFACTYCASHILNDNFRQRDPIKVVDEINYWNQYKNIRNFAFYDDALLMNPEKMVIPMLKEIIRRDLTCTFHCPNGLHLREITAELGRLMFMAGFKTIRFGFESSNITTQTNTGGKVHSEQLIFAVNYLKEAGYQSNDIGIYLLCGMPGQEASEVLDSIHFVQSCGARPIIAEYSPIPNTVLWKESVNTSHFDLEEPLFHNNTLLPCQSEKLTCTMYQELKKMTKYH